MKNQAKALCSNLLIRASACLMVALILSAGTSPLMASGTDPNRAPENPLSPPDTSSPRATLRSFLESFEEAYRHGYENPQEPRIRNERAIYRVIRTLDTSELPSAQRDRLALEAAYQLYEVMARIKLPAYHNVPGAKQMDAVDERNRKRWLVSGTEIEIVEIREGVKQGEFLFSSATLARAEEFYRRARSLSNRPGTMVGIYERVRYRAGTWFPPTAILALPDWLKAPAFGQSLWKWLAALLTIAVWLALIVGAHRLSRRSGDTPSYWIRFFFATLMLPLTYAFRNFMDSQIILIGLAYDIIDPAIVMAYYFFCSVAIINLGAAVAQSIIDSSRIKLDGIEPNLIAVAGRVIAWVVVILLILRGANVLGIPLTAVVASLGVGGIAIGMAARPTIENLIAGVTLYMDKPVRVGEFCQFDDVVGSVEQIGLRSTRIRRWGGNLITIPNSQFAEFRLDNYNDANNLLIRTRLKLRYETTTDQLRYVLAKLVEMLVAHPEVKWPRVRFVAFGDYALEVEIVAYCNTGVWAQWHAIREDLYLRAKEIVEEAGTSFAFPSQTTYFARDPGLNDERRLQAEQRIEEWRQSGTLPFPNPSAEQIGELENTIDFPVEGSVGYKPKSEA